MMAKKRNVKNIVRSRKSFWYDLPGEAKKKIFGVLMFAGALIIGLSFFDLAGPAGRSFIKISAFLIGKTVFIIPLIFILGGIVLVNTKYKRFFFPAVLAVSILILGASGIFASLYPKELQGGWLGYIISWPLLSFFGFWVSIIIFSAIIVIGALIFWHLAGPSLFLGRKSEEEKPKKSLITRIKSKVKNVPEFKVKEIEPEIKGKELFEGADASPFLDLKVERISKESSASQYQSPPLELLDRDKGNPLPGDIKINSAIIKKTLQNFGIQVEMSEINIGPTVTQYTFKPAEGVKLSRIVALSNDLSLALASRSIRIEAPIPGKSLAGIEIPNSVRAQVRLRSLIENPDFQKSSFGLNLALGRDVSGHPIYRELSKMPHLLVAGSTGAGKTIFLNSVILSLLYQNSPKTLRFILIDPKRVEFPVYNNLPHLLTPVIFNAQKTINALKWLTTEMERRFDVLSEAKSRDILNYNKNAFREQRSPMPYIVLIIDELADLMAMRGKEIEASIVRLAQMARAVGIHLIVATQRPSVEVITGLIKANITSRVTFQVASQVDSRTVIDSAGAEKLLGAGDMLLVSTHDPKPRRIQSSYVSEKEVRRVINYIKSKTKTEEAETEEGTENELAENLEIALEESTQTEPRGFYGQEDALYEEAKRTVIESGRASASLLQRRLRLGYARAARLLDMLEDRGVVGPADGAKPREVYIKEGKQGFDEEQ